MPLGSALLLALSLAAAPTPARLPELTVKGTRMVDPAGKPVTLKGANLGNWLMIEMWMLGLADREGQPKDQHALEEVLTRRFGEAEKDRLMNVYRASWMTERDFRLIRSFGFNLARLPINYRLLEDDRAPMKLKADAWRWIDQAVDACERHGIYVILDMHGVQGGQSNFDHTGHSDQNKLWGSRENRARLAWLWGEMAKRYRTRSAVVAYDVFNEPYGGNKTQQVEVFREAYAAIRKHDPKKLVFAHGNWDDFAHYGDPKANGWTNVGFQMHYYPGLFGNGRPTLATHARHLASMKDVADRLRKLNVPFLVGEMNVVFDEAGGAGMMKRHYDTYSNYGWMTTMWSYKATSNEGGVQPAIWGMVVNHKPPRTVDFNADSKQAIEAYFQGFATEALQVHEQLRRAMTEPNYPLPALPEPPPKRRVAPQGTVPGWQMVDIGGARKGGAEVREGAIHLYGGGSDVWGGSDQCRFLYREIQGDFTLEATVDGVEDVDQYTKAGLMVRAGTAQDAAMAILTTFPDGEVQFATRTSTGGMTDGLPTSKGKVPGLRLRLVRRAGMLEGFAEIDGAWKSLGKVGAKFLPERVTVGLLALSHDDSQLAKVTYREVRLGQP